MNNPIYLVQGDTLPSVHLLLRDAANGCDPDGWPPLDVSSASSIEVRIRAQGASSLKGTIACTKTNGGSDGEVFFNWPASFLDLPGNYEGEVVITFPGGTQTVYDLLQFRVRARF